jgi:hypothetical protein
MKFVAKASRCKPWWLTSHLNSKVPGKDHIRGNQIMWIGEGVGVSWFSGINSLGVEKSQKKKKKPKEKKSQKKRKAKKEKPKEKIRKREW